MTRMRRLASLWLALAALVVLGSGSFFEEGLKCEEAVKRLIDCCPGLRAHLFNCSTDCTSPRFSIEASECILSLSCEDVRARGLCTVDSPGGDGSEDLGMPSCR